MLQVRMRRMVPFGFDSKVGAVILILTLLPLCSSWTLLLRPACFESPLTLQWMSQYNSDDNGEYAQDEDMPDISQIKRDLGQMFPAPRARNIDWTTNDATYLPYVSAQELQALVEERAKQNETPVTKTYNYPVDDDDDTADDDDMFSVTLDADAYHRASMDMMVTDESLWQSKTLSTPSAPLYNENDNRGGLFDSLLQSAPTSPDAIGRDRVMSEQELNRLNDAWKATKETLFEKAAQTETHDKDSSDGEELHKQVFAEEQGFLKQSSVFIDSLIDTSQSDQAWVERHGDRFRNRQQEAMAQLDLQILEIEANLKKFATRKGVLRCSRCTGALDKAEIRENEGVRRKICQACHAEDLAERERARVPPPAPGSRGRY